MRPPTAAPCPPLLLLVAMSLAACGGASEPAAPSPGPPAPVRPAGSLGAVLDSLRRALDLPALAGAVVAGERVTADAVGARRAGGPLDVTPDDRFHLGSNTKAMTAALLGTLVDEGRLAWTTTLAEALPDLAGRMRAEYRAVTVRDLLAHVGGLPANAPPDVSRRGATPAEQRAAVAAWALGERPAAARGTVHYSNVGYVLAGAIAERLAGRDYEALLVERVLGPLGVTTAGFGAPGTAGRVDQPWQHPIDGRGRREAVAPGPDADNPPAYAPAGRAHLSVGDWGRFVRWTLAADRGAPQPLLRPATAATLFATAARDGSGAGAAAGWFVVARDWAGGRTLTHAGSNTLSYSVAWLAPGRDFAVLVATNQAGGDTERRVDEVAARLIRFHLDGR